MGLPEKGRKEGQMEAILKQTVLTAEAVADTVAELFARYGDNEVRIFMGFVQMLAEATGLDYMQILRIVQQKVAEERMRGMPFGVPA